MDRAFRVQANQVEQMGPFITTVYAFAVFVSGPWAGVLGCVWAVLRLFYGMAYRRTSRPKALLPFTIPCYAIIFAMGGMSAFHAVKLVL